MNNMALSRRAERRAAPKPARIPSGDRPTYPAGEGLTYVSDTMPGIRRLREGESFRYRDAKGRLLRNAKELQRIRKLAIPPAYEEVWICPLPEGHIQATGRDARGRKQYRYHPDWREARDAHKFERMREFGQVLPRIRAKVKRDLAAPVGSRASVLAALVRLLDTTLVRVGNDEYARENGSFGLTTLRNGHAAVKGARLHLRFRGKSGVWHELTLEDPQVARIVRACQAMPGQELFQYEDDNGETRCVGSADVNDYIRTLSGADFTAKDFRTWHASVHALARLCALRVIGPVSRKRANDVLREVAGLLGNTLAVCRKSYVHPGVMEVATQRGVEALSKGALKRCRGLGVAECRLLAFLSTQPGLLEEPR